MLEELSCATADGEDVLSEEGVWDGGVDVGVGTEMEKALCQ